MSLKTRSEVPVLPPLIAPPHNRTSPSSRDHVTATLSDAHALVPRGVGSRREDNSHELELRVGMLEQAHKMLLEEILNVQVINKNPWGSTPASNFPYKEMGGINWNSKEVESPTLAHLLKQVPEMEKRIYLMQNRMDEMVDTSQRTRNEAISNQREARDELSMHMADLRREVLDIEKRCLASVSNQTKAWSCQLAEVSTALSNETTNGANALTKLQTRLKETESMLKKISNGMFQANSLSSYIQANQAKFQLTVQSRLDELWSVARDVQMRVSAIEAHRDHQYTWLKECFNSIDDRVSKLSANTSSTLKMITSYLQRVDDKVQKMETLRDNLANSQAVCKKERTALKEKLKKEMIGLLKEKEAEFVPSVDTITMEISRHKEKFEEHKKVLANSMSSLSKSVSLIERESQATKEELRKVLEAEIKMRREEELALRDHCAGMVQNNRNTSESLKLSLNIVDKRTIQNHSEMVESIKLVDTQWREAYKHLLADVGTRLSALHVRDQERGSYEEQVKNLNEKLDVIGGKLKALEDDIVDQRKQHMPKENKELLSVKVRDMDTRTAETSAQLHGLARTLQETQMKLTSHIQSESSKRFQDIIELRNELSWLQSRLPQYPTLTSTAPSNFIGGNHLLPRPPQVLDESERKDGREITSPTPEPQSPHSSPSLAIKWKNKSRKGRGGGVGGGDTAQRVTYASEPTETMGTFTSAAPTPFELRKILVNVEDEETSDYLNTEPEHEHGDTNEETTAVAIQPPNERVGVSWQTDDEMGGSQLMAEEGVAPTLIPDNSTNHRALSKESDKPVANEIGMDEDKKKEVSVNEGVSHGEVSNSSEEQKQVDHSQEGSKEEEETVESLSVNTTNQPLDM